MWACAVIGAGYGDEGKGLMTDFLAAARSPAQGVVVRYNGGAQAGHTVVSPRGDRHVFHHYGAGTFAGWPTFLSRWFVSNPLLWARERDRLRSTGVVVPRLLVDPAGVVTTPYDMLLNQFAEQGRGAARHGSCGVGFGETVERSERRGTEEAEPPLRITVDDLRHTGWLRDKLHEIRRIYVPARLAELQLCLTREQRELVAAEALVENFVPVCAEFLHEARLCAMHDLPLAGKAPLEGVLFEGAQGLELDQNFGAFPHVTRSHTGLSNISELAKHLSLSALEVVYVTRAYKTRHGAGPLPHALGEKPWATIEDATNVPHDFQGAMRFGWLDLDRLGEIVQEDLKTWPPTSLQPTVQWALTCLDQVMWPVVYVQGGRVQQARDEAEFLEVVAEQLRPSSLLVSHGPTRRDVSVHRVDWPETFRGAPESDVFR